MSYYITLGPRAVYGKINDANSGKFRTTKNSFGYGRPPLPAGSTELPKWLEESLMKGEWPGTITTINP